MPSVMIYFENFISFVCVERIKKNVQNVSFGNSSLNVILVNLILTLCVSVDNEKCVVLCSTIRFVFSFGISIRNVTSMNKITAESSVIYL